MCWRRFNHDRYLIPQEVIPFLETLVSGNGDKSMFLARMDSPAIFDVDFRSASGTSARKCQDAWSS